MLSKGTIFGASFSGSNQRKSGKIKWSYLLFLHFKLSYFPDLFSQTFCASIQMRHTDKQKVVLKSVANGQMKRWLQNDMDTKQKSVPIKTRIIEKIIFSSMTMHTSKENKDQRIFGSFKNLINWKYKYWVHSPIQINVVWIRCWNVPFPRIKINWKCFLVFLRK